ncbi:Protein phosphatases PP1 regulatory subunit sds22 [Phytophthora palmivora]|uniref:Protein phosphatases PP1 regulatory subunit sds22 n=1 Tax=Phytophthora palmivora TaxID=4796 RepID=A0A2P4Y7Z6_9STRA|nr:Protein phosphatases PP1 regulatory subunit sds22 [Phytophthora palmivora]
MLVLDDENSPCTLDQDAQEDQVEQLEDVQNKEPGALRREQITKRLSVLGRNPFTQAHIYTTATLTDLHLLDIDAIREFPHIQHLKCDQNELQTLSPLQHIPLLLTLDASNNNLTEVLDFEVPKCCPGNAWVDGARWIGSLLRKAILDKNRIVHMPHHELANTHPFLLELRLAHNGIVEISGVRQLRFLRVLDLSHNHLTSMKGLVGDGDSSRGLQALETLLLSHNELTTIDSSLALLPRLKHLDVAHNQLKTLGNLRDCVRLQRLELAHNYVADINELNCLAGLRYLGHLSLHGCPLVEAQVSRVFYRARVLRRLLQLDKLDDEQVTSKEKVKALVMHGSDLEARRQVAAKYLPGHEFTDFLPPIDFEDDKLLDLPLRQTLSPLVEETQNQPDEL